MSTNTALERSALKLSRGSAIFGSDDVSCWGLSMC
jgi:hypothetical protein